MFFPLNIVTMSVSLCLLFAEYIFISQGKKKKKKVFGTKTDYKKLMHIKIFTSVKLYKIYNWSLKVTKLG